MENEIQKFIIKTIERKEKLPDSIDLETFNYIESGYIDSITLISFINKIEVKFKIELSEKEVMLPEFKTIGGLVSIVGKKLK